MPNLDALNRSRPWAMLIAGTLLGGCAVGPKPVSPPPEGLGVPSNFSAEAVTYDRAPASSELSQWWSTFGDPGLTQLVDRALVASTDIEAAVARVRQARAGLQQSEAGWWPTLQASASGARRYRDENAVVASGSRTSYAAGLDAAYEVDLFGGVRRSVQASAADLASTAAGRDLVRVTVTGEVALNYIAARLAQRRLAIAEANLASQDETLQIVGWRVQAGLVGSLDLEQARRLRAQTAAAVPSVQQDFAAAVNRLAVLTAQPADVVRNTLTPVVEIPLAPLPGLALPADVLRRRPDVIEAERALVAETARIGVAEAQLYPALRLTGTLAGTGTSLSNAANVAVGNLVAGITAPIFEGGRLRAQVEQQRAATAAALANYRGALLTAIEDTENAVASVSASERSEAELVIAEDAANNAAVLARSQYQAGLIDFQTLLDSERSLLATQDSRAGARATRASSLVQLYKALGGGWDAPTTMTAAPAATTTTPSASTTGTPPATTTSK
jgi:NodT family efflux transporter outer membrane factor (OMF) lipoprotein